MRTRLVPVLLAAALMLPACHAPKSYDDPTAVMASREKAPATRMAAARIAERDLRDSPKRIAALHQIVWERGYPDDYKRYAVDQLIAVDEADFRQKLSRRIVLINNWDTLQHVLDRAVERNWTELTPAIVRQYARTSKVVRDEERPERAALEKLNLGKGVEEIVFSVFADADDTVPMVEQTAAWELLNRLSTKEWLIELLEKAPDKTPLVIDLKAAAAELHTVPTNREGVLWLAHVRDPARRAWWEAAKTKVARLNDEQRRGLELRHLPVLLAVDDDVIAVSRASLLTDLMQRMRDERHYLKGPTYDGPMTDYPQQLRDYAAQLAWADLVTLRLLLEAVREPGVKAALFQQAEEDKLDQTTEHGGALFREGADGRGGFVAQAFPPEMRAHDLKFLAPQALIDRVYTGLAHYHFHAQEYKNTNHAGPGIGDMEFAKRLNFNCLVFTFVERDRLNVDYYQPNGAVVDLGTLER